MYDKVGNRKQMSSTVPAIPAGMFYYDANDRLTTDNYDANGNTISSAGIENAYDFENRLVRHGYMTMVYDGDGNRVAETVGGVTTNYLVDTQNPTGYAQVVEELQGGAMVRSYTWGHWLLSQKRLLNDTWSTSFYGYDGHGSVRYLTDSAGAVTDTYDYDAFGNLISSTGTTPNNYLFAGEQYDSALGLYYNRARYLDVRTGRFWGMDTYEGDPQSPQSLHKYLYTNNDPANKKDPEGRFALEMGIAQAVNLALVGIAVGVSVSASVFVTSGIFLMDSLPRDAFSKLPDAVVIGGQVAGSPSRLLSDSANPFLVGLAIGLQFTAGIGGFDFVFPYNNNRLWIYGFLGATAGFNAQPGQGNPLIGGQPAPFDVFGLLGNTSVYVGNVWELRDISDYGEYFFCASASPRLKAVFPRMPVNVGGQVCASPPKSATRPGTYTYTVGVAKASGTSVQAGTSYYWPIADIPRTPR